MMSNTVKVILAIVITGGLIALFYYLMKPKEVAKAPVSNTGSGNTLNIDLGGGLPNQINADGELVVNGMTAAQYLAAGYSQADVDLIFK